LPQRYVLELSTVNPERLQGESLLASAVNGRPAPVLMGEVIRDEYRGRGVGIVQTG